MKLLLLGYFDTGTSIGVDDAAFGPRPVAASWPDGMEVALGRGVSLDLREPVAVRWKRDAARSARDSGDPHDRPLAPIIEALCVERCELRVFALGLAVVAFELSGIPAGYEGEAVRIARLLEHASYGQQEPRGPYTGVVTELQANATRVLRSADRGAADTLEELTARTPTYGSRQDHYTPSRAAAGYMFVLLEEAGDDHNMIYHVALDWEGQRGLAKLQMDDGVIWLGWTTTIVSRARNREIGRILSLLELTQVFYGLTETFETLLTRRFLKAARQSLESGPGRGPRTIARPLDLDSLYRLRMLALALIGLTSFKATTNNMSDWLLFDAFEERAQIAQRHARIAHAAQIFGDAESELVRDQEETRAQRVKQVLAIIAALGIIGVVATVIGVVQVPRTNMPMSIELGRLGMVLLSLMVAGAIGAWIVLTRIRL